VKRQEQAALGLASLSLCCGIAVYFFFRTTDSLRLLQIAGIHEYFTSTTLQLTPTWPNLVNAVPSGTHTFSFSIFTAIALGLTKRTLFLSCIAWVSINGLLEVSQLAESCPLQIAQCDYRLCRTFCACFTNGTFDWYDMAFLFVGGALAFSVVATLQADDWSIK